MTRRYGPNGHPEHPIRRALTEASTLLLVVLVVTGLSWIFHPNPVTWRADPLAYQLELSAPLVSVADALLLFEEGDHLFIDTRRDAAEAENTISSAFILRADTFDDDLLRLMDQIFPEDPLILFGNGQLAGISHIVAKLKDRGFENILILREGVSSWQTSGGEVSPPSDIDEIGEG